MDIEILRSLTKQLAEIGWPAYLALIPLFGIGGTTTGIVCGGLIVTGELAFLPVVMAYIAGSLLRDAALYVTGVLGHKSLEDILAKLESSGYIQKSASLESARDSLTFLSISIGKLNPFISYPFVIACGYLRVPLKRMWPPLLCAQVVWSPLVVWYGTIGGERESLSGLLLQITLALISFYLLQRAGKYLYFRYVAN